MQMERLFVWLKEMPATDDFVGWGKASAITVPGAEIRTWSHDNFGEDLILNPRDGAIYYWDKSNGLGNRAVELKDAFASGRTSIPKNCKTSFSI